MPSVGEGEGEGEGFDVTCPEPPDSDSVFYTLSKSNLLLNFDSAESLNDEVVRMADYND